MTKIEQEVGANRMRFVEGIGGVFVRFRGFHVNDRPGGPEARGVLSGISHLDAKKMTGCRSLNWPTQSDQTDLAESWVAVISIMHMSGITK